MGGVTQGVNFKILKQLLSPDMIDGGEAYEFNWVGKKKAIVEANKPIRKTLRPCKEKSKNWDTTENIYIEGDNLEALKLLQESYLGKVKMIYIDPPYNRGSDLIYKDTFKVGQDEIEDGMDLWSENNEKKYVNHLTENNETNPRFHSDWCSMIYPRLAIAKSFLAEDGVFFISIDENEVDNLKKICDEIIGEKCFVDYIVWNKRVPKNDNKGIGNIHEYILLYTNSSESTRKFVMKKDGLEDIFKLLSNLKKKQVSIPEAEKQLKKLYEKNGYDRGITLYNNLNDNYEPWGKINVSWPNANTFGPRYNIIHPKTNKPTKVPDRGWRWNRESFESKLDYEHVIERYDGSFVCGEIWFAADENTQPSSIKYLKDVDKMLLRSIISLKSDGGLEVEKIFNKKGFFSYPKPVSLLKKLINSLDEKDGIYLDFFSGSATTAHAIMELNAQDNGHRKFIMVQLPEQTDLNSEAYKAGYKTICDIGEERIRRAGEKIKGEDPLTTQDLDVGFRVFKVDESNMKDVYYSAEEFTQESLSDMASNIKEDRSSLDLLFGCIVDWGLPLSKRYTSETIEGCTIHNYGDGDLLACFDENIPEAVFYAMARKQPHRVVFRDSCFQDSPAKINVTEVFKLLSPDTTIKVI